MTFTTMLIIQLVIFCVAIISFIAGYKANGMVNNKNIKPNKKFSNEDLELERKRKEDEQRHQDFQEVLNYDVYTALGRRE